MTIEIEERKLQALINDAYRQGAVEVADGTVELIEGILSANPNVTLYEFYQRYKSGVIKWKNPNLAMAQELIKMMYQSAGLY